MQVETARTPSGKMTGRQPIREGHVDILLPESAKASAEDWPVCLTQLIVGVFPLKLLSWLMLGFLTTEKLVVHNNILIIETLTY